MTHGTRADAERLQDDEDRLVGWLRRRTARNGSLIGDDAAVLPRESWAVTTDTQIEGVHFVAGLDPAKVARRLLAVNLSDLAAMGAAPAYAFLVLAAPAGFDHRRFFNAFLRSCREHGIELAGGDLARHRQLTTVLTLLGKKAADQRWLKRSTARAGEHLWLGGTVGEAAAGWILIDHGAHLQGNSVVLPSTFPTSRTVQRAARRAVRRHLAPQPQLALGRWLGNVKISAQGGGAAIDVSDGLARDLHRLCRASDVGAEISSDRLPLSCDFRQLAGCLERDWRQLALGGGEDYVLLFTLPDDTAPPTHFGCTRIGVVTKGRSIYEVRGGRKHRLQPLGWDHLAPAGGCQPVDNCRDDGESLI